MTETLPDEIRGESPATILVYRELSWADGQLSPQQLVNRTDLTERTIRRVTSTLVEADLVEQTHPTAQRVAYRVPPQETGDPDRSRGV